MLFAAVINPEESIKLKIGNRRRKYIYFTNVFLLFNKLMLTLNMSETGQIILHEKSDSADHFFFMIEILEI